MDNDDWAPPPLRRDQSGEPPTILVVDDEPAIRMLIKEAMRELGRTCAEAGDGPHALAIVGETPEIALLIADIGLPGPLDGYALAQAARNLRPDLPVLFVTGYSAPADTREALPRSDWLGKPFLVSQLVQRVSRLLPA